eukprot:6272677-Amphidinium_carterae.1
MERCEVRSVCNDMEAPWRPPKVPWKALTTVKLPELHCLIGPISFVNGCSSKNASGDMFWG